MSWNGSGGVSAPTKKKTEKKQFPVRTFSVAIVILLGIGAWWSLVEKNGAVKITQFVRDNRIKEVKADIVEAQESQAQEEMNTPQIIVKSTEPTLLKSVTNKTGAVIEDFRLPDGSIKRKVTPPKQVWDNAANQVIAMALAIEPGVEAPPLPAGISDKEFLDALKKDIAFNEDDTAEIRDLKRRVRDTRNEIFSIMEETGKSFMEVLQEHREMMNQNTELYHAALKDLKELEQDGANDEELDSYREVVNGMLIEQGGKELPSKDELQNRPRRRGRRTN